MSDESHPCRDGTHLGEAGRLRGSEPVDKRLEQLREDGSECVASLANKVDDEVTNEQSSSLGLRRFEQLGNLCEDELKTRLTALVAPCGPNGQY